MTQPAAASRQVVVGGRSVEVLDLPGSDRTPPLVLLHEGLGSVGLWREFPVVLSSATGRRVIAFSRHGHGRSTPPPRRRTVGFHREEALEVLPEVLDALRAREPVLVGHSDGASIALIYAAHEKVSGLVLLAPHVFVEDLTVEAIRQTRDEFLSGDLRERMARHHDDPEAAFWGWCGVWLDPAFRAWDLEDDVRRVTAPCLLIQGSEDPYGSLAQIAGSRPGSAAPPNGSSSPEATVRTASTRTSSRALLPASSAGG